MTPILTKALVDVNSTLVVEPRIYVTGENHSIPGIPELGKSSPDHTSIAPSDKKSDINDQVLQAHTSLEVMYGRPRINALLHDEIEAAIGPVSVDGM